MLKSYNINDEIEKKSHAVALGFFDGVHAGHIEVIKAALDSCKRDESLSPAVFTFTTKSIRPVSKADSGYIMTLDKKKIEFEKMGIKTLVMPDFSDIKDISPEVFVKNILVDKLCAKVLCCGYDFRFGKDAADDVDDLIRIAGDYNVSVIKVESVMYKGEVISSTRIRDCLKNGQIELANEMLTRPFSFDFPVEPGAKRGRTIGYRTINQQFEPGFVVAKHGVYASVALIDDVEYPAITNIGVRPTVGGKTPVSETHIFGEFPEMYGQRVEIKLLSFIRDERKFEDLKALKQQIDIDCVKARKICEEYLRKYR